MRFFQSDGASKGHPRTQLGTYGDKPSGGVGSPVLNEAQAIIYRVKLTATQAAVLPPTITTQPVAVHAPLGGTAVFTLIAGGQGPRTYQWKKNGVNVVGGSGGTSANYTTPTIIAGDDGAVYTCAVTNAGGTTVTNGAALTLNVLGTDFRVINSPMGGTEPALAYGGGRYVCVSDGGDIYGSPDGENWAYRSGTGFSTLNAVEYGAGCFVAIGRYGVGRRSTDGQSWSAITAPWTNARYFQTSSIAFGNGVFVAVTPRPQGGSGNAIAADGANTTYTSPDGISWTGQSTQAAYVVAFGGGKFVAMGTTLLATSPDGVAWTNQTLFSGQAAYALRHLSYPGDGNFYLVDGNGGVRVSADGITWGARVLPSGGSADAYGKVAYAAGKLYVGVPTAPAGVLLSSVNSGASWQSAAVTGLSPWPVSSFIAAGGRLVGVSYQGNRTVISP